MDGPSLTATDVAQRLRAFHEESGDHPEEDLKNDCQAMYQAESAEGTEPTAIVGAISQFVDAEFVRRFQEQQGAWRDQAEAARQALEQRFLA